MREKRVSKIPGDSNDRCFVCGRRIGGIEVHHIFYGPNRHLSDEDGMMVHLCKMHHTGSEGVHNGNEELKRYLWRIGISAWLKYYGSKEKFLERYGRNYGVDR